jgi:alanine-alpha-ketoisovalerate/valine-pyruvate aminotransferase
MVRELSHPTEAFEMVAEEVMKPFFKGLAETLCSVMPKELDEEEMLLHVLSMFSVVLYFNLARVAVTRIIGREYDEDFKALLVEHITRFCCTGLEGD